MLAQLTPPEISGLWRVLQIGIEASVPPLAGDAPDRMNRILVSLLQGTMQCWLGYEHTEQGTKVRAMALTSICEDPHSGQRDLLLYAFYSYDAVSDWSQYVRPVMRWAKSRNCKRIVAYSKEPRALELAQRLGGTTDWRFIEIPLKCENFTAER